MQEIAFMLFLFTLPVLFGACLCHFFRFADKRGERRHRWLKFILGNFLVFIFLCSSIFLLCEIYYRFIYDSTAYFKHTNVTDHWYRRHWHLNQIGLRDSRESYTHKKPTDKVRISFLGDSLTAGQGIANVEDRFANLIRNQRKDWDVHVFASDGMDTSDQLKFLKALFATGYQSDIIVLVYYLNDIEDFVPHYKDYLARIMNVFEHEGFWVRNSYFINTLYYRWIFKNHPLFTKYFAEIQEAYDGPAWEWQKRRLQQIHEVVNKNQGRLLVVTFPFMHSVGPDYDYREIHHHLDQFLQELGVPHLDLLGIYQRYSARDLVVNGFDSHPNELAHKMAAKYIEVFIDQQMKKQKTRDSFFNLRPLRL